MFYSFDLPYLRKTTFTLDNLECRFAESKDLISSSVPIIEAAHVGADVIGTSAGKFGYSRVYCPVKPSCYMFQPFIMGIISYAYSCTCAG